MYVNADHVTFRTGSPGIYPLRHVGERFMVELDWSLVTPHHRLPHVADTGQLRHYSMNP